MMKYIGVLVGLLLLVHAQSFAEEKSSTEKWLRELRTMVEKIVPKKAPAQASTAVGGVRGTEEKTKESLYWRGKREAISEAELADFDSALALAEAGRREEAMRKFEDFQKTYPSSPLVKDAGNAVSKLKN